MSDSEILRLHEKYKGMNEIPITEEVLAEMRKAHKEAAWVLVPAMKELARGAESSEDGEADPEPKK